LVAREGLHASLTPIPDLYAAPLCTYMPWIYALDLCPGSRCQSGVL